MIFSYKSIILFFSITFMLTACEEDFILQRSAFVPKVVVNSVFAEGKPWKVALSFSRDLLDTQSRITTIENADVYVIRKANGLEIPLRHEGKGIYTSYTFMPEADRNYELVVNVPGYPEIRAKSTSPSRSEILNVFSEVVELKGEIKTVVNFEIRDNNRNFYIWNLVSSTTQSPLDTIFTGDPSKLVGSVKKHANLQSVMNNSVILGNEAEAKGGYFSTTANNDANQESGSGPDQESEVKKKYLRVLTVSEDLYSYYKSVEKFIHSEPANSSITPFNRVYSNINNGLGIFAGYTEKYIEIK